MSKFLTVPILTNKRRQNWILINPKISKNEIKLRLKNADLLISDIDDTDAPSPAKLMAYYSLLNPKFFFNLKFQSWCLFTVKNLLSKGKRAEGKVWRAFIDKFLNDSQRLNFYLKKFNISYIESLQYPGVKEFYEMIPRAKKVYITRNIKEIAVLFQKINKFDDILCKQFNKIQAVTSVLKKAPDVQNIILKGDSEEDLELLEYLRDLVDKRKISNVLGIYVVPSIRRINLNFDINISRNYLGICQLSSNKG